MNLDAAEPSAPALAVIREEEAWLARVATALGAAREHARRGAARDGLRSAEGLRALREEAIRASEDDLPALLHEMSVRQALRARPAETALPDPSAPYLAHLAIREGEARRDYFLGPVSFVEPSAGVRLVDWRVAPVARIFYRCREGEEFEESFPGRVVEGTVLCRRVVVITGGLLERVVAGGMVLERLADGRWVELPPLDWSFREGGAGTAARSLGVGAGARGRARAADVTALLDPTQFAAVTAPAEQPLLVLGSAGSGKTTVALHRLARVVASDPARFPIDRAAVVVPEEGLARLSRRLLEPLAGPRGAAGVRTLDAWSLELSRVVFGADAPRRCVAAPGSVASLKRSPALHDALRERFAGKKKGSLAPKRLWKALAELFTDRPFLAGVVAASEGALSRAAVEATVEHTMLQLAEPFARHLARVVVPEMKVAVDGRPIVEGTPDELAGTIDLEDLPILLCLRAWRGELEAPSLAHLVLDEAEDFSLFELFLLGRQLDEPRSVTLAGDEAQQTQASFAGWERALAALAVHDAATCRLGVSYRCPRPIVELARTILGPLAPAAQEAAREGAPVGLFPFPDEPSVDVFLAGALRELCDREPRASVAVIARDPEAARRLHPILAEATSARLVLEGEFGFEPGIDVTDVDNVKGLEFDYVVVPDASGDAYPEGDAARRRLHVAVTRASHQLWVLWGGAPSPLLGVPEA